MILTFKETKPRTVELKLELGGDGSVILTGYDGVKTKSLIIFKKDGTVERCSLAQLYNGEFTYDGSGRLVIK